MNDGMLKENDILISAVGNGYIVRQFRSYGTEPHTEVALKDDGGVSLMNVIKKLLVTAAVRA